MPSNRIPSNRRPPARLRRACDFCHGAKIRCSSGIPCTKCDSSNIECHYSYVSKLGKPKGSRNKKTLARLAASAPSSTATSAGIEEDQGNVISQSQSFNSGIQFSPQPSDPDSTQGDGWRFLPGSFDSNCSRRGFSSPLVWTASESNIFGSNLFFSMAADKQDVLTPTAEDSDNYRWNVESTWLDTGLHDIIAREPLSSRLSWPFLPLRTTTPANSVLHAPDAPSSSQNFVIPRASPAPRTLESECRGSGPACVCLKQLTDHLYHLNTLDPQQSLIHADTALGKADIILNYAARVIGCRLCRSDSKVLLLVVTVIQTVLNWITGVPASDTALTLLKS